MDGLMMMGGYDEVDEPVTCRSKCLTEAIDCYSAKYQYMMRCLADCPTRHPDSLVPICFSIP